MNNTESALRSIKDRIASALGDIDEAATNAAKRENYRRLTKAALDLHSCADEMQNIMMRIKPR